MDKSASQSRLSRSQLPPQEAGNTALRLDQLTDLDQAISLSRGEQPPETRPTPVATHSAPKSTPAVSAPALPKPAPTPKPTPKPTVSQQPLQPKPAPVQPTPIYTPVHPAYTPAQPTYTSAPQPVPAPSPSPETPPVVPVRSAKEAINAMYAGENPARLSDYLGASAKEIINATARGAASDRDAKSASSLHHASSQRKIEASRPSASAIFRAAKSEKSTPVVHTSLELEPQSPRSAKKPRSTSVAVSAPDVGANTSESDTNTSKPDINTTQPETSKPAPIVINSRSRATNSRANAPASRSTASVRPKKGQIQITTPTPTAIAVSTIAEAAGAVTKSANSAKSPKTAPGAKSSAPSRTQSSRRPGLVDGFTKPRPRVAVTSGNDDPYQKLPADSVKRRFRLAPKGFAANKPEQARPARRRFMSFSNPDYTVPIPKPSPAAEIYGLTEPEPAPERNKDGLGVVEDYRPQDPANPAMNTPAANTVDTVDHFDRDVDDSDTYEFPEPTPGQKFAAARDTQNSPGVKSGKSKSGKTAKTAPDNNRYSLGGQSPFFLKSVNVEKRPLSDAPTRRADTISPIYTDPGDEVPRKNVYDGKSKSGKTAKSSKKSSPRDLPQRPTVIIPSSRRSHTPLFLLLILTVILGAAVGAAVYFFFFQ